MTAWLDFIKSESRDGESLSKRLKRASKIWKKMKKHGKTNKKGKHRGGADLDPLAPTSEASVAEEPVTTGGEGETPLVKAVGGKTTKRSKRSRHSYKSKKSRK